MARNNQGLPEPGGAPLALETADLTQLRAELGMLRALYQQQFDSRTKDEADRVKHAEYLAWVALTATQKTQIVADRTYRPQPGDELWEVELQEQQKVRLWAHGEHEARGRYNALCGITSTMHEHTLVRVGGGEPVAGAA